VGGCRGGKLYMHLSPRVFKARFEHHGARVNRIQG
jgi:hypothetical protein